MTEKIKNTLEFALLTVGQPLSMNTFKRLLGNKTDTADIRAALKELADDWATRSMQLVETASGYQFISRPEYTDMLKALLPNKAPRLSKPLMEVLTIIAYRQPGDTWRHRKSARYRRILIATGLFGRMRMDRRSRAARHTRPPHFIFHDQNFL